MKVNKEKVLSDAKSKHCSSERGEEVNTEAFIPQCNSDRYDLADEYDDPIQRAEIRAGA